MLPCGLEVTNGWAHLLPAALGPLLRHNTLPKTQTDLLGSQDTAPVFAVAQLSRNRAAGHWLSLPGALLRNSLPTQSIILFLAAQTDEKENWTLSIEKFKRGWGHRYIYSLYFGCTTMFTVGYGDITPKNTWELITILIVQVVGISSLIKESLTLDMLSMRSVGLCWRWISVKRNFIKTSLIQRNWLKTTKCLNSYLERYVLML